MSTNSKTDQEQWEEILRREGFGMGRGSLGEPAQSDAVLEYLETHATQIVPSTALPDGFSTSQEMTELYLKEESEKNIEG